MCTFFHQKLTTALLESVEGREWPKKIFHDQISMKECCQPGGGRIRNLLITSWTRIQLSHWGQPHIYHIYYIWWWLNFGAVGGNDEKCQPLKPTDIPFSLLCTVKIIFKSWKCKKVVLLPITDAADIFKVLYSIQPVLTVPNFFIYQPMFTNEWKVVRLL